MKLGMKYGEEFESDIEELENTAIHLAICDIEGQVDPQQENQFAAVLDHIVNTYKVDCETVVTHIQDVSRIWKTRNNSNTASKHVDTVHQAFMSEVCDDYDPQY